MNETMNEKNKKTIRIEAIFKNQQQFGLFYFGRGDATRTRNRRFWRPLLYH